LDNTLAEHIGRHLVHYEQMMQKCKVTSRTIFNTRTC